MLQKISLFTMFIKYYRIFTQVRIAYPNASDADIDTIIET